MATHTATITWRREHGSFADRRYNRAHTWAFDGGIEIPASSSPHVVPAPMSNAAAVDPEEAFVAAIASCHMLWFLSIAAQKGFIVDEYIDEAVGVMAKNVEGKLAVTRVTLRPKMVFSGSPPTRAQIDEMHHLAHEGCFIANSVKTDITVEPADALS